MIVCRAYSGEPDLPPGYVELFDGGTSPADWAGKVPSLDDLREHLKMQPARTRGRLSGRLQDALAEPFRIGSFIEFHTVGEVLNFAYYHEAIHLGFIKGLLNALGA